MFRVGVRVPCAVPTIVVLVVLVAHDSGQQ